MSEQKIPIPAMLYNAAVGGHVTNSQQIIDENLNREQNDINQETVGAVPYNSTTPNGMGRIVLKKTDNFKEVVEAQTNGNTIFVIKYDFTLTGNVTIPANCVLEFDGGSISGAYTITGQNTGIEAPLKKIFGLNITIGQGFSVNGWCPEWFGAVGYGRDGIMGNQYTEFNNYTSSVDAIQKVFSVFFTSGCRTMLLNAYYFIDDEISYSHTENIDSHIIGNGDCGFFVYINDATKFAINTNKAGNVYNWNGSFKDFNVYLDHRCNLKGVLRFGRTLRSDFTNIIIMGGFSNWEEGGFTLHSAVNDNIFNDNFEYCAVFNSNTGHGIYYKAEGYPAVGQVIRYCKFQQLGGCGIVSEPGTQYNFGATIEHCEIEGNVQGAIFIPTGIQNTTINGIGWEGTMTSVVDSDYPIAPFILGAKKVNNKFEQIVEGFTFVNSGIGNYSQYPIDYFLFMGGTDINGNLLEGLGENGHVYNTYIDVGLTDINGNCKCFTILNSGTNIRINTREGNNLTYVDIGAGDCVVKYDILKLLDGHFSNVVISNHKTTSSYTYLDNGLVLKGVDKENAPIVDVSTMLPDQRLVADHYYRDGDVFMNSMYYHRKVFGGIIKNKEKALICIYGGGRLISNIKGTITQGSTTVQTTINTYDNVRVGDTLVGPWYKDGKAIVVSKTDEQTIIIDNAAVKSGTNVPITGAIVLPIQMGSPATVSGRSVFENTDYIPVGANVFSIADGKPVWWNGSNWVDATGTPV